MTFVVLSGFVASLAAPFLHRLRPAFAAWVLAAVPAAVCVSLAQWLPAVVEGDVFSSSLPWSPVPGMALSFRLDGLSLVFALLISGVGALVVLYAGSYLAGHPQLGRFYALLLAFMASMLGVVLADNLIALFMFWELTSITSYLLIGFEHDREPARSAALQALLVTGLGGLALLAGLLLIGLEAGTFELTELLAAPGSLRGSTSYPAILALLLLGAFTKSAQFPFHFWLPKAMEAPTPASAYLHAATMVKAGVYLLARLHPVLGDTQLWFVVLTGVGAATMVVGAWLAIQQTYMKRLLAYTTVSALGTLVMLLGIGGSAATAVIVFLVAHGLYKGALFLVAGILDHETGERDVMRMGGLRRALPVTAAAATLGALSMAGIPPLLGFVGKELIYGAAWNSGQWGIGLASATVLATVGIVTVAGLLALRPFWGARAETQRDPHEAPPALLAGPVLLALAGLGAGIAAPALLGGLVTQAAAVVSGRPVAADLGLWHGWSLPLLFDGLAVTLGICAYLARNGLREAGRRLDVGGRLGPGRLYDATLRGLNLAARGQTRLLQSGYLRAYLMIVVMTTVVTAGYVLTSRGGTVEPPFGSPGSLYELGLVALILVATVATVRSRSRLGAVAALGVVGYGVALVFVLYGAPDLAMTQFVIETLTVILFVLVFYHLPPVVLQSSRGARARDLVVALTAGGLMSGLTFLATKVQFQPVISSYFSENSVALAHGRNIVNVILVDFRGVDTLGEITVLGIAGVGVYAMLRLRSAEKEEP